MSNRQLVDLLLCSFLLIGCSDLLAYKRIKISHGRQVYKNCTIESKNNIKVLQNLADKLNKNEVEQINKGVLK